MKRAPGHREQRHAIQVLRSGLQTSVGRLLGAASTPALCRQVGRRRNGRSGREVRSQLRIRPWECDARPAGFENPGVCPDGWLDRVRWHERSCRGWRHQQIH